MWTTENRSRDDRSRLRYPSDLTDDEWALIEPLIPRAEHGGDYQPAASPKDFPPRSTVNNYLLRWQHDRMLDQLHHALYVQCREHAGRDYSPTVGIIDMPLRAEGDQASKAWRKG